MDRKIEKKDLPEKINILGMTFDIELDASLDPLSYGETESKSYIIKINPLHYKERKLTLLHECIHAALGVSGLSEIIEEKVEEAIVVCIENALYPYFSVKGLK